MRLLCFLLAASCLYAQAGKQQQVLLSHQASAPAGITITNTGDALCAGANGAATISLGTTAATGNFIAMVAAYQGAAPPVTDNYGNTYIPLTATASGTPPVIQTFYAANAVGGVGHTISTTATFNGACAIVASGLTSSPYVTDVRIADNIGTTIQPGPAVPVGVPALFLFAGGLGSGTSFVGNDSSFISSGLIPFTSSVNYGIQLFYKISSVTENPIFTYTPLSTMSAQTSVFK